MQRTKRNSQQIFSNEMNQFFDDLFGMNQAKKGCAPKTNYFRPPVNITETDDDFIIDLMVPGWEKNDFEIKVEGDYLTIKGENAIEAKTTTSEVTGTTENAGETAENATETTDNQTENVKYIKREFKTRNFKRTFTLSDKANKQSIDANYVNGILTIKVAKLEDAKPVTKIVKIS